MLAGFEDTTTSGRRSGAPERSRCALIVDDERIALMFLERQVRDLGCEILTATNGQEALDLLRARPAEIDVIVLDREMPILDGIALVKRTRQDPALRRIPIIMVTGIDQPEQIREGIDAGRWQPDCRRIADGSTTPRRHSAAWPRDGPTPSAISSPRKFRRCAHSRPCKPPRSRSTRASSSRSSTIGCRPRSERIKLPHWPWAGSRPTDLIRP